MDQHLQFTVHSIPKHKRKNHYGNESTKKTSAEQIARLQTLGLMLPRRMQRFSNCEGQGAYNPETVVVQFPTLEIWQTTPPQLDPPRSPAHGSPTPQLGKAPLGIGWKPCLISRSPRTDHHTNPHQPHISNHALGLPHQPGAPRGVLTFRRRRRDGTVVASRRSTLSSSKHRQQSHSCSAQPHDSPAGDALRRMRGRQHPLHETTHPTN
jgi:hypothetical protein